MTDKNLVKIDKGYTPNNQTNSDNGKFGHTTKLNTPNQPVNIVPPPKKP